MSKAPVRYLKMINYLRILVQERDLPPELAQAITAGLDITDEGKGIEEGGYNGYSLHEEIGTCLTYPKKQVKARYPDSRPDGKAAPPGVYKRERKPGDPVPEGLEDIVLAFRIFVVRERKDEYTGRPFRFAREVVPLKGTQGDRANEDGNAVRYQEIKAPRMQFQLLDSEAMQMELLTKLSIRWSKCIVCGHGLSLKKSQDKGIGPVCEGRQRDLLSIGV